MEDFETKCNNEIAAYQNRIFEKQTEIHNINEEIKTLYKGIQMRKLFLKQSETLILPGYEVKGLN